MGMNVKDIIWVFQINPPRNMAQLMQRFGRAARDPALRAIETLVLSKHWRGISAEAGHVPKNQVQRGLNGEQGQSCTTGSQHHVYEKRSSNSLLYLNNFRYSQKAHAVADAQSETEMGN